MYLATAIAILTLAIVAAIFCLRSYRPTRVPVVERARVPQDVRAKVNTDARLRLHQHQHRRAGRDQRPTTTADVAPVATPVSAPSAPLVRAAVSESSAPLVRAAASARTAPLLPATPPDSHPLALVQRSLAHNRNGAPRPGSYFRTIEAPSQETIISDVRGPWAAEIVTRDGRITLPDSGADLGLAWGEDE